MYAILLLNKYQKECTAHSTYHMIGKLHFKKCGLMLTILAILNRKIIFSVERVLQFE